MARKKKTQEVQETVAEPAESRSNRREDDRYLLPPVTLAEANGEVVMVADLPGVRRESLKLEMENQILTVEGELRIDFPSDMQASQAELAIPRFRRAFRLGNDIDPEQIEARLEDGVLSLRLGKKQAARRRRIEVSA